MDLKDKIIEALATPRSTRELAKYLKLGNKINLVASQVRDLERSGKVNCDHSNADADGFYRWSVVLVLLLAFLASGAAAQNLLPEAPKAKAEAKLKPGATAPLEPSYRPPSRKVFWLGTAGLATTKGLDAYYTRKVLDKGGFERNWLYGKQPSVGRQVGVNLGLLAGQVLIFHYTEKSRHGWVRWLGRGYIGYTAGAHAAMAVCNARLDMVGGKCPMI